jgi:hypothetical protein
MLVLYGLLEKYEQTAQTPSHQAYTPTRRRHMDIKKEALSPLLQYTQCNCETLPSGLPGLRALALFICYSFYIR